MSDTEEVPLVVEQFLQQISEELASGPLNLPCFPGVVSRVRQAITNPKSTAEDIVRVAGTEPRLSARLIQTASSSIFNPTGVPLTNLRQAVTRLGNSLVQSVTMAFAMQQMKADSSLRAVAEPLSRLWEKSIAVASICQVLARRLGVPPDKVFLTGLLHGIGHFYILVRAASVSDGMPYETAVRDFIADWHPELGRAVLESWGFEQIMCDAVGHQNRYERTPHPNADITDVVIVSVALAEVLLERAGDRTLLSGINALQSLKLSEQDINLILTHTEHNLSALREVLLG